jgi:hypothetical protein
MVLRAVVSLYEQSVAGNGSPDMFEVVEATGLSKADVNIAAIALEEAGLVVLTKNRGDDELKNWRVRHLGPDARRLARQTVVSEAQVSRTPPSGSGYIQERVVSALGERAQEGTFDFGKLLRLVVELNVCYEARLSYATHMLIRAIIDHVPPLLGHTSFASVASQYAWSQTDRNYIRHLKDFRAQADDALHRQISREADFLTIEGLPPSAWLNTLLAECAKPRQANSATQSR